MGSPLSGCRLPNLLVIGAMKAGTTSMWAYLGSHPQVYMSSTKKIDFFSMNWGRGCHHSRVRPETTYSGFPGSTGDRLTPLPKGSIVLVSHRGQVD